MLWNAKSSRCVKSCLFRRNVGLTPLQEEKRQRDLEREREAREQLEARCISHPLSRNTILTPSQREERKLERGEKESQERLKVCSDPRLWSLRAILTP